MGIGASIFLIALGAIIVYGITGDTIWWLDVDAVGWVVIAAGLAVLVATVWSWRVRRRRGHPSALEEDRGMLPNDRKFTEEYRTEVHPPERR